MQARMLTAVLAAATGLAATVGGVAAANGGKPAPTTGRLALPGAPVGYTLVSRGPFTVAAGKVSHARVPCPRNVLGLVGGGAIVLSTSPLVSLASDFAGLAPRLAWHVSVVNASSAATSYSAYAICFRAASTGVGDGGAFQVAPHSLDTRTDPGCGYETSSWGGQVSGTSTQVLLHETRPTLAHGWVFSLANNSATTRGYELWVDCNQQPGAHVIAGPPVSNPPLTQTHATAMCDTGVPLAGGVGASSGSTLVSVNTSSPITGGWQAYENNASLTQDTIRAWVVCSGS